MYNMVVDKITKFSLVQSTFLLMIITIVNCFHEKNLHAGNFFVNASFFLEIICFHGNLVAYFRLSTILT